MKKRLLAAAGAVTAAAAISTAAFGVTVPTSHSAICAGIANQEAHIANQIEHARNATQAQILESRLTALENQAAHFGCTG